MKIDPYLSLCTKLKSKDLNIKLDTLTLIKKVGNKLELIGREDNFLKRTPIE